jgi:hypothetical protein
MDLGIAFARLGDIDALCVMLSIEGIESAWALRPTQPKTMHVAGIDGFSGLARLTLCMPLSPATVWCGMSPGSGAV